MGNWQALFEKKGHDASHLLTKAPIYDKKSKRAASTFFRVHFAFENCQFPITRYPLS
jgi:hypothetical protein